MRAIDQLLEKYGESHQNGTNKLIHWICVPTIMFTIFGIFYAIPFPFSERTWLSSWATVALGVALVYYLRLSVAMFWGFVAIGTAMLLGGEALFGLVGGDSLKMVYTCLAIFATAWVFQFIGHNIEGKKPSFLDDLQFLLVGPAWLLHFIYKKIGVKY